MSDTADMRFTHTHEWVLPIGETVRVGLSDFAQHQLADIISVELPEPDDHHYEADEDICVVESLNSAQDLRAPISGVIVAINTDLLGSPELINSDPYDDGWIVEMRPDSMSELDALMDLYEYEASLPEDDDA